MSETMDERRVPGTQILGKRALLDRDYRLKLYDFRRPDKFSKEQMRSMQLMHETFARLASVQISGSLRQVCTVKLELVDQMTFGEFIVPLSSPCILTMATLEPLKGQVVLHIDRQAGDAIIQRLFGGGGSRGRAGSPDVSGSGELTDFEHVAIGSLLEGIFSDLGKAWFEVEAVQPAIASMETNPVFCQVTHPNEMIILTGFSITLGESKGTLHLVYPYALLEPIISKLSAKYWYRTTAGGSSPEVVDMENYPPSRIPQHEARTWQTPLPTQIMASLGNLSVAELRCLKKGSVIFLPEPDRAWLRCGSINVAELSGLNLIKGEVSAAVDTPDGDGGRAASEPQKPADIDPVRILAAELRQGMASLKAGMAEAIAELKSGQETLSDKLIFGQLEDRGAMEHQPFASLSGSAPADLALFLNGERPQLMALVLSNLDDVLASRVLSFLPEAVQTQVVECIGTMDWVASKTIECIETEFKYKLSAVKKAGMGSGGVGKVVGILNLVSREVEKRVINSLDKSSPEFSEEIKKNMFVFEDISMLDDESISEVLAAADEQDLLVAMKPVPEALRERIFARFSESERARLKAAFGKLARVRLTESDAAGQRIVSVIRALEEEGRIVIVREDE